MKKKGSSCIDGVFGVMDDFIYSKFYSRFHVGNGRVKNDGTWQIFGFLIGDLVDRGILDVRD